MLIVDYDLDRYDDACVLLLGYFDGVHLGHRSLISKAEELAKLHRLRVGIMTFYDSKNGGQIYDFSERVSIFESLGIDFVYAAHYSASFRETEGEDFLDHILKQLDVRAFVCGEDFSFGKGGNGKIQLLTEYSARHNIDVFAEPLVQVGKEKAAACLAKKYLDSGDVKRLASLLGERYFISGRVSTEGRHVGRTLGFPTANIYIREEKYPLCPGVYAVTAFFENYSYRGIANYGNRPTFEDKKTVLEVYLDGYHGDLYGKEIKVCFDFRIRSIQKFANMELLSKQLQKDLEAIR